VGCYLYLCFVTLPKIERIEVYRPYEASKLYSYDNELLTEFYLERRNFVSAKKIPQHVKNAFIAVEDKRFYRHFGIDFVRIAGAILKDIEKKAFAEGASTITQQLAKMLFLSPEKTITRKTKEIILSFQLERKYTKDEILGLYLNQAYLGTRAYGIEAAAQTYFGKASDEISVAEAALLATLPKAPSNNSPFKDPEEAMKRRESALKKMLSLGFINEGQYQQAVSAPIPEKRHRREYKAPYFVDYQRKLLEKSYGDRLYISGLKIYTTLDYKLQQAAEAAVSQGVIDLKKRGVEDIEIALIAVELKTGRIKAMVGGTNYDKSQFNRVNLAKRQPGSAFKPVVYLTALINGFSPNDIINDEKVVQITKEGRWVPKNYDNIYHGKVSLETAFKRSLNAATVNLAKQVGIENVISTAKMLGIKSVVHPFYSSALGASELSLLEMVYAYAALSHGYGVEPVSLTRVIDRGQPFIMEPKNRFERVIDDNQVKNIKKMLRAVILDGTGRQARKLNRAAYGKTGTTNGNVDAWFIGFDEKIITGVWVGRDNSTPIGNDETGASAALPVWLEFMESIGREKTYRYVENRLSAVNNV
jgi:penicillin-binding protein 1A